MLKYSQAYDNWKKEYCVDLYEHANLHGKDQTHCLNPENNLNYIDVKGLEKMKKATSSIKVGKHAKVVMYENGLSLGQN